MAKFMEFIRRERLYVLLLVFVLLVSLLTTASRQTAKEKTLKHRLEESSNAKDVTAERANMERVLKENKPVAVIFTIASLLIMFVLLLGLIIDFILVSNAFSGRPIDIRTYNPGTVRWGPIDIARVVVLFLFFGYMLVMIESFLVRAFPIIKNGGLRMVFNSSILDTLTIILILYFTVGQYKAKLKSLGISLNNFFHNVFYGVVGYIAALPVLFLTLLATSLVTKLIKYTPKEQVVVEIFMKHNNPAFLVYTSIFAAIAGPVVEELFFRGFMYNAVKKYTGIKWSIIITAALFAGLHSHPVGFLPIMILGVLLAYLYEKTGTLVAPITVHVMHNFGMLLLVFLSKAVKGM